jgi:hypothetical protein
VAFGLSAWLDDLLGQALTYGFAVGEPEIAAGRNGVPRLWSYNSPSIGFRSDAAGALEVVQRGVGAGDRTLNRDLIARVTHSPEGCDPNGESMFFALPLFCQAFLDIMYAYRATWRRNGVPIYHINVRLDETVSDPDGEIAAQVRAGAEDAWNEAMRSQVLDGKAKDFFSVGDVTVTAIGADAVAMDIQVGNRAMTEHVVSATGIPPFLFGFQWSTTERLSGVQADLLTETIKCLRREAEGALLHVGRLHLRLQGRAEANRVSLRWPDVSMADLRETSFAAHFEGLAKRSRQAFGRQLWTDGVWGQQEYADYVLEHEGVPIVTPMEAPPIPEAEGDEAKSEDAATRAVTLDTVRAMLDVRVDPYALPEHACNGKH